MLLLSRTSCLTVGAVSVLIGMLSGCAPTPDPKPSPTPAFASEEQAFAAAEKVYRAYNDAVNADRIGEVGVDPSQYLSGNALETHLDATQSLEESGSTVVGDGTVASFLGISATTTTRPSKVRADVCIDVSATRVIDQSGADVTPPDRPTRIRLEVEFIAGPDLLIADSQAAEDFTC